MTRRLNSVPPHPRRDRCHMRVDLRIVGRLAAGGRPQPDANASEYHEHHEGRGEFDTPSARHSEPWLRLPPGRPSAGAFRDTGAVCCSAVPMPRNQCALCQIVPVQRRDVLFVRQRNHGSLRLNDLDVAGDAGCEAISSAPASAAERRDPRLGGHLKLAVRRLQVSRIITPTAFGRWKPSPEVIGRSSRNPSTY